MTAWLQKILVPILVETATQLIQKYVADPIFRSRVDSAVIEAKNALTKEEKLAASKRLQSILHR